MNGFAVVFAATGILILARLAHWFLLDLFESAQNVSFSPRVWAALLTTGVSILPMTIYLDDRYEMEDWSAIENRVILIAMISASSALLYFLEGRETSYRVSFLSCALAFMAANLVHISGG